MTQERTPDEYPYHTLEALYSDPKINAILDTARRYESEINEKFLTVDEIAKRQKELDKLWPFMNDPVSVNGKISRYDKTIGDWTEEEVADDRVLVSTGFFFLPKHIMVGEEVVARQYEITFHYQTYPDENNPQKVSYNAGLDKVAVDYPNESFDKLEARLRYFHPDYVDQLDEHVLGTDDEVEAVLALEAFELDLDLTVTDNVGLVRDIERYVNGLLTFDKDVPYVVEWEGLRFITDGVMIERSDDLSKIKGIARIFDVRLVQIDESPTNPAHFVTAITADVYGEDRDSDPERIIIPIENLTTLVSIRQESYGSDQ